MDIEVCIGSACHLKGSYQIIAQLEKLVSINELEDLITIKAAFCLGYCTKAVAVKINKELYSVDTEQVQSFFETVIREKVSYENH